MTNKEAIAYFKRHIDLYCVTWICREAEEMAIKALEQEPCENCISRQAVLGLAYDMSEIDGEHFTEPYMVVNIEDVQKLSPVTPQPKTGRWKKMVSVYDMIEGKYRMIPYTRKDEELGNPPFYVCDCGNNSKKPTHYCPDCGAKMVNVSDINDGKMSEIPAQLAFERQESHSEQ